MCYFSVKKNIVFMHEAFVVQHFQPATQNTSPPPTPGQPLAVGISVAAKTWTSGEACSGGSLLRVDLGTLKGRGGAVTPAPAL